MHIIRNDEKATWTLVPTTSDEERTRASVASFLSVGDKMQYHGRGTDPDDENAITVRFNAGGKYERVTKGNSTNPDYVGGVTFHLIGTTPEDKDELGYVRDTCYVGSGGLILVEQSEVDGTPALVFTAKHCKLCGAPMIKMGRCEWETCDACSDKCEHELETGAIHGGGIDLGLGQFCGKCGIAKPKSDDEPEKSPLAHALAFQRHAPDNTLVIHNGVPVEQLAAEMEAAGFPVE